MGNLGELTIAMINHETLMIIIFRVGSQKIDPLFKSRILPMTLPCQDGAGGRRDKIYLV